MFRLNFGLKPVSGFKPRFETLVLTKDKVTHYILLKHFLIHICKCRPWWSTDGTHRFGGEPDYGSSTASINLMCLLIRSVL